MSICIYPGSFDPVSNGHLEIIERASNIFDTVYVIVSINPNKNYTFTNEERLDLLNKATKHLKNVKCELSDKLILQCAKEKKANAIVRGVRNYNDYQDELTRFQFNRSIDNTIDTVFFFPSRDNLFLSSTAIKELAIFNSDISLYVPKHLSEYISKTIRERKK